jgi:hypothetical protein
MSNVRYAEIEGRSTGYYGLVAILGIIVAAA